MKKFKLTREWSGYSRGRDYIEVEAETLEEALEIAEHFQHARNVEREVVRDDTETEEWELDE